MANGFFVGVRTVREEAAGKLRADEQALSSGNQRDRARAEDDLTQEIAYYRWLSTVTRARLAKQEQGAAR